MPKFGRNYILNVQAGNGLPKMYPFSYPLTLRFSIRRDALQSANDGNLKLYNLSAATRQAIYKDCFANDIFIAVNLQAGYGDNLSTILSGNVQEAKSYRESGSTDYITELDCRDWSYAMNTATSTWSLSNPKRSKVINTLIDDLVTVGVQRGIVNASGFDALDAKMNPPYTPYPRGYVTNKDNTWSKLVEVTNCNCFIDNGKVNCLMDSDGFNNPSITTIDSSTGLLSTPKKMNSLLKIDILFEPRVQIGQVIKLVSESESLYSGQYKVIGIQHNGIISGAVNGKCVTSLILNSGNFAVDIVTGEVINTPMSLVNA